jgi:hypothetical protein
MPTATPSRQSTASTALFCAATALIVVPIARALDYKLSVCIIAAASSFACCWFLIWIGRRLGPEEFGLHAAIICLVIPAILVVLGAGAKTPDSWRRQVERESDVPSAPVAAKPDTSRTIKRLEAEVRTALLRASVHAKNGQVRQVEVIITEGLAGLDGYRGDNTVDSLALELRRCLESARARRPAACTPSDGA